MLRVWDEKYSSFWFLGKLHILVRFCFLKILALGFLFPPSKRSNVRQRNEELFFLSKLGWKKHCFRQKPWVCLFPQGPAFSYRDLPGNKPALARKEEWYHPKVSGTTVLIQCLHYHPSGCLEMTPVQQRIGGVVANLQKAQRKSILSSLHTDSTMFVVWNAELGPKSHKRRFCPQVCYLHNWENKR